MGLAAGHQTLAGDIPAHIPDDVRGFVRAFGVPQTLKDYAEIVSRQRVDLNCMTAAQKYILKNHIVIFKSIRAGTMPPPDAWNAFVAAAPHDVATDSPSRLAPQSAIGEDETVAQTLQHKQVSTSSRRLLDVNRSEDERGAKRHCSAALQPSNMQSLQPQIFILSQNTDDSMPLVPGLAPPAICALSREKPYTAVPKRRGRGGARPGAGAKPGNKNALGNRGRRCAPPQQGALQVQVKPEDGHWYKAARRDLQLNHDSQPKEARSVSAPCIHLVTTQSNVQQKLNMLGPGWQVVTSLRQSAAQATVYVEVPPKPPSTVEVPPGARAGGALIQKHAAEIGFSKIPDLNDNATDENLEGAKTNNTGFVASPSKASGGASILSLI
ncbi:hypothetical protein CYMTET_12932 [Cymbomonas tetramitiformis]|uniref:Uncharacterized protein n=1 Tax=Cymbomonas tetramitiformis TaxID=36881 RepID=A0AAE0LBX8_9CHLO|nr:hypothetical protein CYMTET_12932 [Cymbomonas tetramitiformis]